MAKSGMWMGLALATLLGLSCARGGAPTDAASGPPPLHTEAAAPFDVSAVIRQVSLAFRPEGEGWTGGPATYAVQVSARGFSLTPRHHPASGGTPSAQAVESSGTPEVITGAPATFGEALITRGGAGLGTDTAVGEVQEDGSLALKRGGVEERLRNGEAGLEQSWAFAAPPGGSGDLRVEVPVGGLAYAGETDSGLHFQDAATGLGVRYGHGTWVDARGTRTPVPVRYAGGRLVLEVPEAVLATSAWPAVLDPVVSPELGLDGPVLGPANGAQFKPRVAWGGGVFLVAWFYGLGVTGTRVTPDGQVLDPRGLVLGSLTDDSTSSMTVDIAFDGTSFLLVMGTNRFNTFGTISATRVSPDGTVHSVGSPLFASDNLSRQSPSVAANGSGFLVTWVQVGTLSGRDIYASRVGHDGQMRDGKGFPVVTVSGDQWAPQAAASANAFFIAWLYTPGAVDQTRVYGVGVYTSGGVASRVLLSDDTAAAGGLELTSDGSGYLLTWTPATAPTRTWGTRISSIGARIGTSSFGISPEGETTTQPRLAWDGTRYLVAWQDGAGNIRGTRVSQTGEVLDPSGLDLAMSAAPEEAVDVAGSASAGFLVVWNDRRLKESGSVSAEDVLAARVEGTGQVLDPVGRVLSLDDNAEATPAVASDGKDYLLVWVDTRSSRTNLLGTRVSATGTVMDPAGFVISGSALTENDPAVTWGGTQYLVAWRASPGLANADIHATRVGRDGTVLDPAGIVLTSTSDGESPPQVTWDGVQFVVAWDLTTFSSRHCYGTRVTPDGRVLDRSPLSLATSSGDTMNPAVAGLEGQTLVVWRQADGLYARRLGQNGSWRDGASQRLAGGSGLSVSSAQIASRPGADTALVVWTEYNSGTRQYFIRGTRVTAAGQVLDPGGVTFSPVVPEALYSAPTVAHDGLGFLVVWLQGYANAADLYGVEVGLDGSTAGPPFVVSDSQALTEVEPILVSGAKGQSLIAYEARDVLSFNITTSVEARLITRPVPNTPPVALPGAVTLAEDGAAPVVLEARDPDEQPLTFTVVEPPAHGTLSGTPPALTFTPEKDFHGADAFTFTVSDGQATSAPATVSLTVTSVNDAPVAFARLVRIDTGTAVEFPLTAKDTEGDALTYSVVSPPAVGTLNGTPPVLAYTAPEGFRGTVTFTFTASDGASTSAPATVTLQVGAPPPHVAVVAGARHPAVGQPVAFTARATTPASLPLSYAWDFGDGAVSSEPAPVHAWDSPGPRTVTVTVSDGQNTVSAAVTVDVGPEGAVLVPGEGPVQVDEGAALVLRAAALGEGLAFTWDFGDGSTRASGSEVTHAYADEGESMVALSTVDSGGNASTAARPVHVHNLPPVPEEPLAPTVRHGEPLTVQLAAADVATDALRWEWVAGPGAVTPDGRYSWTPDTLGSFTVVARVTDDVGASAEVAFVVTVSPPAGTDGGCSSVAGGPVGSAGLLALLALMRRRGVRRR